MGVAKDWASGSRMEHLDAPSWEDLA